jgi:hypothetical protein
MVEALPGKGKTGGFVESHGFFSERHTQRKLSGLAKFPRGKPARLKGWILRLRLARTSA